jgi:3-phosphoshikimate 1-carboxyvinyltransferase
MQGGVIEGAMAAGLIDEIRARRAGRGLRKVTVRDARELRVKETDHIATVAENMRRMGIEISTADDGFHIPGNQRFRATQVDSFEITASRWLSPSRPAADGDHR